MSDESMERRDSPRRRNASATREAILRSARARFAEGGYDGTGVRDIAAGAGVNAALVIRYFGSKEDLFAEAIAGGFDLGPALAGSLDALGERLSATVIHDRRKSDEDLAPLMALLRSVPNDRATALLRARLDAVTTSQVAERLGGSAATRHAGIIVSLLLGALVSREILRTPATTGEPETLRRTLGLAIQAVVDDARG